MKVFLLAFAILDVAVQTRLEAQVVPSTPTKFSKRGLGAANTAGSLAVVPQARPGSQAATVVRTVTYIALSPARQWTNAEGKPLLGKLIAFEDMTTEELGTGSGAKAVVVPTMPKLAAKPTAVQGGKVRLLVGQQPFEVALDKLSAADRDFVETIQRGIASSPP